MKAQEMLAARPENLKFKTAIPLTGGGKLHLQKADCHFHYYVNENNVKHQPCIYLCEHRTLADLFLTSALFDPMKNVLCVSTVEWENYPEAAKKVLKRFRKIFRDPYRVSPAFIRELNHVLKEGKSVLLPVTEDARGMDLEPFVDERNLVRFCRLLQAPVIAVTFHREPDRVHPAPADVTAANAQKSKEIKPRRESYDLDVFPLLAGDDLNEESTEDLMRVISETFRSETATDMESDFQDKKKTMFRKYLRSELNVTIPVELYHCTEDREPSDKFDFASQTCHGILRADMCGIALEICGKTYQRKPGALKSLARYPGRYQGKSESGSILIYPYFDTAFYLFTANTEDATAIQAAVQQMYEVVSAQ